MRLHSIPNPPLSPQSLTVGLVATICLVAVTPSPISADERGPAVGAADSTSDPAYPVPLGPPSVIPSFTPAREQSIESWQAARVAQRAPDLVEWPTSARGPITVAQIGGLERPHLLLIRRTDARVQVAVDVDESGRIENVEWHTLAQQAEGWNKATVEIEGWPFVFGQLPASPDAKGRVFIFNQFERRARITVDEEEMTVTIVARPNQFHTNASITMDANQDGDPDFARNTGELQRLGYGPVRLGQGMYDVIVQPGGSEIQVVKNRTARLAAAPAVVGADVSALEFMTVDNKFRNFAEFRGKPVLVHSWGSWCTPCAKQLPQLKQIIGEFTGEGLQVLGINRNDSTTAATHYIEKREMTWLHTLQGDNGALLQALNISGTPAYIVIGRDGTIHSRLAGVHEVRSAVESAIQAN